MIGIAVGLFFFVAAGAEAELSDSSSTQERAMVYGLWIAFIFGVYALMTIPLWFPREWFS